MYRLLFCLIGSQKTNKLKSKFAAEREIDRQRQTDRECVWWW